MNAQIFQPWPSIVDLAPIQTRVALIKNYKINLDDLLLLILKVHYSSSNVVTIEIEMNQSRLVFNQSR